jgi:hypothetical protein
MECLKPHVPHVSKVLRDGKRSLNDAKQTDWCLIKLGTDQYPDESEQHSDEHRLNSSRFCATFQFATAKCTRGGDDRRG